MTDKERFERIEINLAKLAGALEASTDDSNVAHLFGVISKRFVPHPLPEQTPFQKWQKGHTSGKALTDHCPQCAVDAWNACADAADLAVPCILPPGPLRYEQESRAAIRALKEPVV